jgi:hypothetical protein
MLYIHGVRKIPKPRRSCAKCRLDRHLFLNKIVRHVFNIWKLKELISASTEEIILLILPINLQIVKQENSTLLVEQAHSKCLTYLNKLTNKEFEHFDNCLDFFDQQKTTEKLYTEINNKNILPNLFKQFDTLEQFILDFSETGKSSILGEQSVGLSFGLYLQSQFIRVQEHRYFCEKINAEPIYDYELPWFFYTYEFGGLDMDASIVNALQKENFEWLCNVPISAIKVFREEEKLDYMRSVLRTGITDLKAKKDENLIAISEQLEKNLEDAFKKQKEELQILEKEVKAITKKEMPITAGGFLAGFVPYLNNVIFVSS